MKHPLIPSLLAATLAISAPLSAQDGPAGPQGDWTFAIGAMGLQRPAYSGSSERRTSVEPFVELDYKGLVGIKGSSVVGGAAGIYVRPLQRGSWTLGALFLTEMGGRNEDDAKALKGMGDRDANAFFGLEASYRTEAFFGSMEVLKGSKSGSGMVAGLTVGRSIQLREGIGLELGLTGIWGNQDYQVWESGITPVQASRRQALIAAGNQDLRAADGRTCTPRAGLREVRASAMVQWEVTDRWKTFAVVEHGRLLGDAADSPLTRRKSATGVGLGFAYQFCGGSDGGRHGH